MDGRWNIIKIKLPQRISKSSSGSSVIAAETLLLLGRSFFSFAAVCVFSRDGECPVERVFGLLQRHRIREDLARRQRRPVDLVHG